MPLIELKFKKINFSRGKRPMIKVSMNEHDLITTEVRNIIQVSSDLKKQNTMRLHFINKKGSDTIVDNKGKIIEDLNFELEGITIDKVDIKHLIWESQYVTDNESIRSCLFFGPPGYFEIKFETPVLKWFLQTNHEKNKNDPDWEKDYKNYIEVCQILDKIQKK